MHGAGRNNFDAKVLACHSALERALFTRTIARPGAPGGVESDPQKFTIEVTFQPRVAQVWGACSVAVVNPCPTCTEWAGCSCVGQTRSCASSCLS